MPQPTNENFLAPHNFVFTLERTPLLKYFCQTVLMPSVSLGEIDVQTPFINTPKPGDKLVFDSFNVTFKIDEDMKNYNEIFDWMVGIGAPNSFDQYAAISGGSKNAPSPIKNVLSDATLVILSSHKNPNINVFFKNCFPINLSIPEFNVGASTIEYMECTATFRYQTFKVEAV